MQTHSNSCMFFDGKQARQKHNSCTIFSIGCAVRKENRVGKTYGYALGGISTDSITRQLEELKKQGVAPGNLFSDSLALDSGRGEYRRLLSLLKKGDLLVVCDISALGNGFAEIQSEWHRITEDVQASIVVLDMPLLDTRRSLGDANISVSEIVLQVLAYLTETKKESARQRQAEGIASARAQGVRLGRPPKKRPKSYREIKEAYRAKQITRTDAAKQLKVSPRTFDRWLKDDEASASQRADKHRAPRKGR